MKDAAINEKILKPFSGTSFPFELKTKISFNGDLVALEFTISNLIDSIILPSRKNKPQRTIGLWNATCFELFLKNRGANEYVEFNFSPTHDWNCFKFQNQNDELKEWIQVKKVEITSFRDANLYQLKAVFLKSQLPSNFQNVERLLFSTTTVLKHSDDSLSYWAIKHTDNRPNFHHPESFTELVSTIK